MKQEKKLPMLRTTTVHNINAKQALKIKATGFALAATAALILNSCTTQETSTVNATHMLQTVNLNLDHSAKINDVNADIISIDALTGKTATENRTYTPRDVINDLPIRVTTRYTTPEKSGDNLKDLANYNGDLTIDITIENLTVKPQELTYDVAGVQRTQNALVGVPLTVAGSTTLPGVKAHNIRSASTLTEGTTNGIISSDENGNTVVQWAAILAGPSTGASTIFTLDLQATNFSVPSFNLAIQAGMMNDLTASTIITTATDSDTNDLELVRSTIETVGKANTTLADASHTISEIRNNLNTASSSLEGNTVQSLKQASDGLAERLENLTTDLDGLKTQLSDSATNSQNDIISQLQQTVETLDNFIGATNQEIPQAVINSETCQVDISQPSGGSTVYSNMIQLSNVLDAYGTANTSCRDQMIEVMNQIIGPENPSPGTCVDSISASCSLYTSSIGITSAMLAITAQTEEIITQLQPGILSQALADHATLSENINNLNEKVAALTPNAETTPEPTPSETPAPLPSATKEEILTELATIETSITDISNGLSTLKEVINSTYSTANDALSQITTTTDNGGSMLEQNQKLAEELCALTTNDNTTISQEQVEHLRSYLTNTPCQETSEETIPEPTHTPEPSVTPTPTEEPVPTSEPTESATSTPSESPTAIPTDETIPTPSLIISPLPTSDTTPSQPVTAAATDEPATSYTAPDGFSQPMEARLKNQADSWNTILTATNLADPESVTSKAFADAESKLDALTTATITIRNILETESNQPSPTEEPSVTPTAPAESVDSSSPKAVQDAMVSLNDSANALGSTLQTVSETQDELNNALKTLLADAPEETVAHINEILGNQLRTVNEQKTSNAQAITDLFNHSINDLTGNANAVSNTANNVLTQGSEQLKEQANNQAEEIDRRTQDALQRIQESTNAATQDAEGASIVLTSQLEKIMLDVGDSSVAGSGLLGSLSTGAAKAGDAEYQLSLATENAERYTHIREEDIASIRLKQAQYSAIFQAVNRMPAFQEETTQGADVKTLYAVSIGEDK